MREHYLVKPSKKSLYYRKRHFGSTANDRTLVKKRNIEIKNNLLKLEVLDLEIDDAMENDESDLEDLEDLREFIKERNHVLKYQNYITEKVDERMFEPLPKITRKYRTIDSLQVKLFYVYLLHLNNGFPKVQDYFKMNGYAMELILMLFKNIITQIV